MLREIFSASILVHAIFSCFLLCPKVKSARAGDATTIYDSSLSNSKTAAKLTSYNDFKSSYFDNLTTNFGKNYKGSCGYVAIGMILSYYDTYLNDNIILEDYDIASEGYSGDVVSRRNSPGIYKDNITKFNNKSAVSIDNYEYLDTIASMTSYSFHAKLIYKAYIHGFYDFDNDEPLLSTLYKRTTVLNDYLTSNLGYKKDEDYTIEYIDKELYPDESDKVRKYAIEQVKNGYPVIISVKKDKSSDSGHALVVYDYDEDTDQLYGHMGLDADRTHVTIESQNYTIYKSAMVLKFNQSHSHSNNYVIKYTVNNKTTSTKYCFHNSRIDTRSISSTHVYDYGYEKYSNSKHKILCECGNYVLSSHVAGNTYKSGNVIYANCIHCNEIMEMGKGFSVIA